MSEDDTLIDRIGYTAADGDLEAACDLIQAITKASTNGEALGAIVRFRKDCRMAAARAAIKADRELRAAGAEPVAWSVETLGDPELYSRESDAWSACTGGQRPEPLYASPAVADKVLPSDNSRGEFEAFHVGRKNKGVEYRKTLFDRREDGTYAEESVQRHWWTWQNSRAALRPAAPELSTASIQEQWNSGDQFTVREVLEGAWRAGYYDAEYTHDSAYAAMKSKAFADDALKDLLTGDLRDVMADVDAHALGCVRKAAGEPLNTARSRDIVQRSIEEYAGAALIRSGEQAIDPKYKPCYVCERPMDGLSEDDCHCFHRKELLGADRSSEQAPAARFDHVECQECGAYYVCERCGNSEPEIV